MNNNEENNNDLKNINESNKENNGEKKIKGKLWLASNKVYYPVVAIAALLIIGTGVGVFQVVRANKSQADTQGNGSTTIYSAQSTNSTVSTKEEQANVTAKGVADTRTLTSTTTTSDSDNKPYTGSFTAPVAGDVAKGYSDGEMVKSNTMGDWRTHDGTDFSGTQGEVVLAVQDGTVKNVYNDELYGKVVEIEFGGGLKLKYCGLENDVNVKKGDKVSRSTAIGTLGSIPVESADGIHLHLEAYVNGKIVNPVKALNMAS